MRHRISISMTEKEEKALRTRAKRDGESMSAVAKRLIFVKAKGRVEVRG